MKNLMKFFALAIVILGFSANSFGQVTENTSATAKILTVLTLTETQSLEFGSMGVLAGQGGTCKISTAGIQSVTGGVTASTLGNAPKAATYHVTGEPNYTYDIQLPTSITISNGTPADDMTIGTFLAKSTSGVEAHDATGTLIAVDGDDDFTVGATLTVAAGQTEGAYTGSFDVTVVYN